MTTSAVLEHQHHYMVSQVCDLIDGFLLILGLGGDDHLGALLAHLFQNLIQALLKEIGSVGALFFLRLSALDQRHQRLQREILLVLALPDGVSEAGGGARVAGGAVGLHGDHQGVVIAVRGDGYDVLIIAAGLSLQPQLLTGAAVKASQSLFHGDGEAFPIHIRQGENLLRYAVHHNGGDQPILVKFECIYLYHW